MMRYAKAFRLGRFGRADVESTIELEGIAIDDLSRKFYTNLQGECAFSGACGSGNDNQGGLCEGIHLYVIVPRQTG